MFGRKKKVTLDSVIATFTTAMDNLDDIVNDEEISQMEVNEKIAELEADVGASTIVVLRANKIKANMSALIDA